MKRTEEDVRCGVCDRPETMAICEACREPTCGEHLTKDAGDYVCTLCQHERREERARRSEECPGHPAGPYDPMGETVYCDGTCVQLFAEVDS